MHTYVVTVAYIKLSYLLRLWLQLGVQVVDNSLRSLIPIFLFNDVILIRFLVNTKQKFVILIWISSWLRWFERELRAGVVVSSSPDLSVRFLSVPFTLNCTDSQLSFYLLILHTDHDDGPDEKSKERKDHTNTDGPPRVRTGGEVIDVECEQ